MQRIKQLFTEHIIIPVLLILFVWGALAGPIRWYGDFFTGGLLSFAVLGIIAALFFFGTLWLIGSRVLPVDPHSRTDKANARRVVQRFALGTPTLTAVVREGKVMPDADGKSRDGEGGIGVIDLDSTSAIVLVTDTGLSRIVKPSLVFTTEGEKLGLVIDLRIQLRTRESEYVTRDGIPIKVRVTVRFQIAHVRPIKVETVHGTLPRPYSWTPRTERAILGALSLRRINKDGTINWDEIPLGLAEGKLRAILAEYTFDQLTEPLDPDKDPRSEIKSRLQSDVKTILAAKGINLLTLGVGLFLPKDFNPDKVFTGDVDKITQQRIKAWRAAWEGRIIRITAEGQATSEKRRDVARTQAQMELITRITQALEQGVSATDGQDQMARRFLETLQKMAAEPYTDNRLNEESKQLLRDLLAASQGPDQNEQSPDAQ